MCCPKRRRFLEEGWKVISAAALSGPTLAFLSTGCQQAPLSYGGPGVAGGVSIPNSPSNTYTFNFSDYPQLQTPGGSLTVTVAATSGSKSLFVTRVDANTVDTVSTICTHAGCMLNPYNATSTQYYCPCHGSIFSATGAVINGPAVIPLPSYASTISSTGIQVTIP